MTHTCLVFTVHADNSKGLTHTHAHITKWSHYTEQRSMAHKEPAIDVYMRKDFSEYKASPYKRRLPQITVFTQPMKCDYTNLCKCEMKNGDDKSTEDHTERGQTISKKDQHFVTIKQANGKEINNNDCEGAESDCCTPDEERDTSDVERIVRSDSMDRVSSSDDTHDPMISNMQATASSPEITSTVGQTAETRKSNDGDKSRNVSRKFIKKMIENYERHLMMEDTDKKQFSESFEDIETNNNGCQKIEEKRYTTDSDTSLSSYTQMKESSQQNTEIEDEVFEEENCEKYECQDNILKCQEDDFPVDLSYSETVHHHSPTPHMIQDYIKESTNKYHSNDKIEDIQITALPVDNMSCHNMSKILIDDDVTFVDDEGECVTKNNMEDQTNLTGQGLPKTFSAAQLSVLNGVLTNDRQENSKIPRSESETSAADISQNPYPHNEHFVRSHSTKRTKIRDSRRLSFNMRQSDKHKNQMSVDAKSRYIAPNGRQSPVFKRFHSFRQKVGAISSHVTKFFQPPLTNVEHLKLNPAHHIDRLKAGTRLAATMSRVGGKMSFDPDMMFQTNTTPQTNLQQQQQQHSHMCKNHGYCNPELMQCFCVNNSNMVHKYMPDMPYCQGGGCTGRTPGMAMYERMNPTYACQCMDAYCNLHQQQQHGNARWGMRRRSHSYSMATENMPYLGVNSLPSSHHNIQAVDGMDSDMFGKARQSHTCHLFENIGHQNYYHMKENYRPPESYPMNQSHVHHPTTAESFMEAVIPAEYPRPQNTVKITKSVSDSRELEFQDKNTDLVPSRSFDTSKATVSSTSLHSNYQGPPSKYPNTPIFSSSLQDSGYSTIIDPSNLLDISSITNASSFDSRVIGRISPINTDDSILSCLPNPPTEGARVSSSSPVVSVKHDPAMRESGEFILMSDDKSICPRPVNQSILLSNTVPKTPSIPVLPINSGLPARIWQNKASLPKLTHQIPADATKSASANTLASSRGMKSIRPLRPAAIMLMTKWYEDHISYPYPSEQEKVQLASAGGITLTQVNAWFANRRNRSGNTKPKQQKRKLEEQILALCQELSTQNDQQDAVNNEYIVKQISAILDQSDADGVKNKKQRIV